MEDKCAKIGLQRQACFFFALLKLLHLCLRPTGLSGIYCAQNKVCRFRWLSFKFCLFVKMLENPTWAKNGFSGLTLNDVSEFFFFSVLLIKRLIFGFTYLNLFGEGQHASGYMIIYGYGCKVGVDATGHPDCRKIKKMSGSNFEC